MIHPVLFSRIIRRNSTRFFLTLLSLVVCALSLALVFGIVSSVKTFLSEESQELLGGDIVIETNSYFSYTQNNLLRNLIEQGARFSERIETLTVVRHLSDESEQALLVSLKVIDDSYPLFGNLTLEGGYRQIPQSDEIFVAPELLQRLALKKGDTISLGIAKYKIAEVILMEPDRLAGGFRFGPLVMLSRDGWDKAGIDKNESRIDYFLSIDYPESSQNTLLGFKEQLSEEIEGRGVRITYATDGPGRLDRILDSATKFFFAIIVLVLFLVLVNIRVNLIYFLASFQKTIAIFRSLGMKSIDLFLLFVTLFFLVATFAVSIGVLLGNLVGNSLLPFIEKILGANLPHIGFVSNYFPVFFITLFLCFFATAPFVREMLRINPKLLLYGYNSETLVRRVFQEIPLFIFSFTGLFLVVWILTKGINTALIAVGGIGVIFGVLFVFIRLVIFLLYRSRTTLPFVIRSIISFLRYRGIVAVVAISSLAVALTAIFTIALIEENVVRNLQGEFKESAPNLYLIDIQESQREGLRQIMGVSWEDFSVTRGRFIKRDSIAIQEQLQMEDPELSREFNLTARGYLISGEMVTKGEWHGSSTRGVVSIEEDFAERAKLHIGSEIEFSVQGVPINATVTSLRKVESTNGLPFFFLVFSPDVLEQFPKTHFGYAYIEEEKIPELQNTIAEQFPNITSIPTAQILDVLGKIVEVLSVTVAFTAFPALCLGILLVIIMIMLAIRERSNDMLIFTVFGARFKILFTILVVESTFTVFLASLFSFLVAHGITLGLNIFVFEFTTYYFSPEVFLLFVGITVVTVIVSSIFAFKIGKKSPSALLRKSG